MSKSLFKLKELVPVGFAVPNYPVENCAVCRGKLLEPCDECKRTQVTEPSGRENNLDSMQCCVENSDNKFYHTHCKSLIVKNPAK